MRVFLFIIAFFFCQFSWAQQSQYSERWVEVDTLELRGQVASALKVVDEIRASSKNSNGIDYVKASIFRWKFLKITKENAENSIFQEVNQSIAEASGVDKALFGAIKAKLLQDYYETNNYRSKNRSTGQEKIGDITEWSNLELVTEIVNAYQETLRGKEVLLKTPASDLTDLLTTAIVTRAYKPTLYDIIAQEAMQFYNSSFYGIERPDTLFDIDHPAIFEDSSSFRAWNFKSKDSLASKFNAVKLLQEVEEVHKNDTDVAAYVFAQLQRLQFAKKHYTKSGKEVLYEKALVALSRKHNNHSIHGLVQYELASHYVDQAPGAFKRDQETEKLGLYSKAASLCKTIIADYPNSEASVKATQLLKEIHQASLAVKTKKHTLPGVENRLFVSYRNLDSLRVQVLKLSSSVGFENYYNAPDLNLLKKNNPNIVVQDHYYVLPKSHDKNYHTAEFLLPPLEHGYYLVFVDNTRLETSYSHAFTRVEVSRVGHTRTEYNDKIVYQWYDRISGQPLPDLKIETTGDQAVYETNGFTDELGEHSVGKPPRNKNYNNNRIDVTAIHKGDTLRFQDYVNRSYEPRRTDLKKRAKAKIFLDREIYRPGQPMYFKGILLKEVGEKSEVVSNEKVKVFIRDANYKEIFKKEFVTNEYGSFSGEFDLPENVLAGRFSIQVKKGDDKSDFWDEWDSYSGGYKSFSVEAYKRPTFEVTFDKVTQAYQPNDSIRITGNAKAFLGSNITGATGTYTIKRSRFNRYWYYYRNRNNDERQLDAGTLQTDAQGNFKVIFKADYETQSLDAIFEFIIKVAITDVNGETREETARVKVGKKNLYTIISSPEQLLGGEDLHLRIANKNLNDVGVACDNALKIFKLQVPERVMFDRLWETPEYQTISKSDYTRAFPQEPYDTDSMPQSRGKMVYEGSFKSVSEYETTIKTDRNWEAGEYLIEHIAQGENDVEVITTQSFTVIQPTNTYLPADQLFSYEVMNEHPKKDGFVSLKLNTSLKNLPVFVYGYYNQTRFFAQVLAVNGTKTVKITLDPAYKYDDKVVVRLKYAQYDRFFSTDIPVDLSEPEEYLQLETQSFRSKLYPDSKETWSFKITNREGKKAQAEVLASMYDMSLDNFAKSYWNPDIAFKRYSNKTIPSIQKNENYISNFRVNIREPHSVRYISSYEHINYFGLSLGRGSYEYGHYLRKLRGGMRGLDEVVGYSNQSKDVLRALPSISKAEKSIALVQDEDLHALSPTAETGVEAEAPQEERSSKKINFKNVNIRKNLQETAFFYPHLTTNKKGEIKFNFDAPQLLTRWKFRLLAHSKNLVMGDLEKEIITQKDLSLVPNTPRFLREGDEVQLSAKVANLTNKVMKGSSQLQLFDAATMQPIDAALANTTATQDFVADAQGNASIFWKLTIPVGTQAITYRMVAKAGKFSDGEENVLAVLPNRMLVTETVPFLVRAGQEKKVAMTHLLANTSKTLTHQQFVFEYTANPSWYALQSLPYLMEFPHECAEQTFSRLYANSLSEKVLHSNPKIKAIFTQWKGDGALTSALEKNEDLKSILIAETPWLRDAQSETERKKRLGLLFDLEKNAFAKTNALKKLRQIQNGNGGFPWFSGGKSSAYISRHIVAGFGHMQRLGIAIDANNLLRDAIHFLDKEIEQELARFVKQGGKEKDFYKRISNLYFLYARSFFENEFPLQATAKQIAEKTLMYYNTNWLDTSVYEKGLLALINERKGNHAKAKIILTGVKESAVQSKINGMYWKNNTSGWYWYQAPIETHALMIEAFDEILDDQKTVEELKIWLLQQKRTSDWGTTKATAAATYALLMSGTHFVALDDSVHFIMEKSKEQEKITNAPQEVGTGYLKATWSADEVTKDAAQVTIKNTGTTVGYGGMYWQYFEDLDKIEKGEEQILNLNKKLFLVNDQDATARLEEITPERVLNLGQKVRVQLTIKAQSNMEFVHLKDMRASGLEPLDVLSKHTYQDGISYYQSTRDVATHFFFDVLPQGTYVVEYDLRVNTKGFFSNGISIIQSMYAPEFSGNTAGLCIKVD